MKSVLITGAAGFLGRHIARHFSREAWNIVGVDVVPPENAGTLPGETYHRIALPNPAFLALLRETKPDVCIHAAGRASVPLSLEDPAADFRDNVGLTYEVLDAIRREVPKCRFILLSSAAVYGNPASLPVAETQAPAPLSPYGWHKRICETLVQEFAGVYGIHALSVRIFSAYGPGLRRQVVWDICQRVLTTGKLSLGGTGMESRDFIHATDIARALALLATDAPARGEIYNLADGRETTISDLASLILRALESDITPAFDGRSRPGDPLNWRADITLLRTLGFSPQVALENGLSQFAAWARAELA